MTLSEEDQKMIKELQRAATMRDPTMGAAVTTAANANAVQAAAANTAAGPAMAFMAMNMAQQTTGVNAAQLYQQGAAQQQAASQAQAGGTFCPHCGKPVQPGFAFCASCGKPLAAPGTWTCPKCGRTNDGAFCPGCGTAKP